MYLSREQKSGKPDTTKVLGKKKSFLISTGCRGLLAHAHLFVDYDGQVDENDHIQDGEHYLEHSEMADDLIKLPGQERPGQDQGKVLGPSLFQHQPGAFDNVQGGVEEDGEADLLEPLGAQEG